MKRLITFLICITICLCLCGCDFYAVNTEKLLTPPRLTGELYPIQQALIESIKGEFTLKYPSVGDIKSAVVTNDLDGDGIKEAFAFYSTTDGEQTFMHINMLLKSGKKYKSVDDNKVEASGIERVDFIDIDGDGIKEITIGWEIYAGSEKSLAIYKFSKKRLSQRMLQNYTNFICCDLDENGDNEILIQELNTKESTNKAGVYKLSESGVTQVTGCMLDGMVKTVEKFELSTLSTGKPAVYIDEIKGIGAVTEVLFMADGELKNPLLDSENTMENITTVRSSTIGFADVNNDGIFEIPIASAIPCADKQSEEKIYYTNWCSFGGEALTLKQVSIVNTVDGYSINVPKRWINNISVLKNTDKRTRTIYVYDSETGESGEKIITFKAISKSDYDEDKQSGTKLCVKGDTVFIAEASEYSGNLSLSKEELETIISTDSF